MRVKGFFLFFSVVCSGLQANIDFGAIEKDLQGKGLRGWIHGAARDFKQYVFTYRDPGDFFTHAEFSLIPGSRETADALGKMERHDEVMIHGKFRGNSSAQKHITVTALKVLKEFDPGITIPSYHRQAKLPGDLLAKKSLLAIVHAVAADGQILVLEYKDSVVPVHVEDTALSKDLFRGDKIRLYYTIQKQPGAPTHIRPARDPDPALQVLDRIEDQHGENLILEGSLVFFPKSPLLLFGVYALQTVDTDGLKRNHTLVNFEDPDAFSKIRRKLEILWKAQSATAENGRNCLVNPQIRIRAKGVGNVVSPSQANPQIVLGGPDDVELVKP